MRPPDCGYPRRVCFHRRSLWLRQIHVARYSRLLDSPTEGSYILNGQSVANLGLAERARIRNREVGFTSQRPIQFDQPIRVVAIGRRVRGRTRLRKAVNDRRFSNNK